jgi:hypothetical protein
MNFQNDNASVETTLIGLLFSLTFSSLVIAFLLLQFYGITVVGNNAPIMLPSSSSLSSMQDYTTNTISDNVNYDGIYGTWVYVPGVGRVLQGGYVGGQLILKSVVPVNDEYIVTYQINNSVHADYGLVIRKSNSPANIILDIRSDGFHLLTGLYGIEWGFYPYTGALDTTKAKIKTILNEKEGTVKVYFQDQLVIDKTGIMGNIFGLETYYAGVLANDDGFTVESINPSFINTSGDIWSQLSTFIAVLAKIVVWNVDSQFLPLELNLIFIKTQLAGVIICAIVILRG